MNDTLDLLNQFPQTPGATGGDAFLVAFYVMVSMVVLVGIAYVFSRAFKNRLLEDWAKNEFLQVMLSAAIVGGLFFLMAPGTGIIITAFESLKPDINLQTMADQSYSVSGGTIPLTACDGTGLPEDSVICYSYQYLTILETQITNLMAGLFMLNILLDVLSKLSVDLIVVNITPLAGISSVVQIFNSMLQTLLSLGVLAEVEKALLQFINATALTVFLPIGAVLRTFFGTRRLGGALIALAVGMYIIFPLTIALNTVAVSEMDKAAFSDFMDFFNNAKALSPMGDSSANVSMTSPDTWAQYLAEYSYKSASLSKAVTSIPKMVTISLASLVVQVVFLPVLSILLTVLAIKELAGLFGSEINLGKFEV